MNRDLQDKITKEHLAKNDENAFTRKKDHIDLAFQSQINSGELDQRFYYEPLLSGHPKEGSLPQFHFGGKVLRAPIWVSSMTGGTELAKTINQNLARVCKDFGMGMGLGSCRSVLYSNETLPDFDVRHFIGDDLPLYANLGIAQLEQLLDNNQVHLVMEMMDKLSADGLIIHVNPLQEWLQPEGDRFKYPPLQTIEKLLDAIDLKLMVKEVGQGMGRESLKALMQLPLEAIEFAANGGTNFAKVELLRSDNQKQEIYNQLAFVGHSADEMVNICNELIVELGDKVQCSSMIISGGVRNYLDGYYYINKLKFPAIFGQASNFLKVARGDYDTLFNYVDSQIQGLELAYSFLSIKEPQL